jgi:hypothetical protein
MSPTMAGMAPRPKNHRQSTSDGGVGADRQADEGSCGHQHGDVPGERRQQGADGIDEGVGDQERLAAEAVGQRAGEQRSCGRAE